MSSGNSPPPHCVKQSAAQDWRQRSEERRPANIKAKVIRASGASHAVTITDMSDNGLRIEGASALVIGENVLLLLPNHSVVEVAIRWVLENQAGARIVD